MIRLLAEVLVRGKGCPVCGGKKDGKARTCRPCLTDIGPAATKAVDQITETAYEALIANTLANSGDVVRGTVWGPFLANTRIDQDARFYEAKGDIKAYWMCKRGIPGGFVTIFIFGDNLARGQEVTGLAELKVKFVPTRNSNGKEKQTVHYLRVQVIEGVKSDMRLAVLEPQHAERMRSDYLPFSIIRNETFDFAVGFLPVQKPQTVPEEKAEACAG